MTTENNGLYDQGTWSRATKSSYRKAGHGPGSARLYGVPLLDHTLKAVFSSPAARALEHTRALEQISHPDSHHGSLSIDEQPVPR